MTDAYIQAKGATFAEALESSATALFDTMCNVKSISPQKFEEIEVEGDDEESLLHNWLESLLLKFELERMVYSNFKVTSLSKSKGGMHLIAKIGGESYDNHKHEAKVEVKAVTYHQLQVVINPSSTLVRFILDL